MTLTVYSLVIVIVCLSCSHCWEITSKNAVVTLVTGTQNGYHTGAIALGQSIIDVGSKLRRVVMVTPDVDDAARKSMGKLWEVREVKPIACNHKLDPAITPDKFDLKGEQYQAGLKRWENTCTKFAAWTLHDFDRVLFMDSDTLVIGPIDDALYGYSNASFVAAPEVFPPDTFNSGFIVLNPSKKEFKRIMDANRKVGSAEGGDQGVFNNGVCPNWYTADHDDKLCGRLPWLYNVEVAHFTQYSTLRKMSGQRPVSMIHFVSDGKPWKVLMMEYLTREEQAQIPLHTRQELSKQAVAHMYWRQSFFKATNEKNPKSDFLVTLAENHGNLPDEYLNSGSAGRSLKETRSVKGRSDSSSRSRESSKKAKLKSKSKKDSKKKKNKSKSKKSKKSRKSMD